MNVERISRSGSRGPAQPRIGLFRGGTLLALAVFLIVAVIPPAFGQGQDPSDSPPPEETSESAPSRFSYSEDAVSNAAAESRLDSVLVRYADGRKAEALAVHQRSEGAYLTLGDFGRIAGNGFRWDPETWRGSLRVDSVDVRFVLDTPIFWIGDEAVHIPAPVRYADEQVLVPLGLIDAIFVPVLRERCSWDPATGNLRLAYGKPWLETVELNGGRLSASLVLGPVRENAIRFRWDPTGWLHIELRGTHTAPEPPRVPGRVDGIEIVSLTSTSRGCEVVLRLDPQWVGIRTREGRGSQAVVDFTARESDTERGRFEALGSYLDPRGARGPATGPGRHILIELPATAETTGVAVCMLNFADRLRLILEQDFGHVVVPVDDRSRPGRLRSPAGLPETPGVPEGDCWVGFRFEDWPSAEAREFLLVVPDPPPKQQLLAVLAGVEGAAPAAVDEADAYAAPGASWKSIQAVPWGQVPRVYRSASRTLARTMAEHLNYEWEGRPVRIASRPARIFRGLAMPAVLVYPSVDGDAQIRDALCDDLRASELARNLAFALDEFLLGLAGE